MRLKQLLVKFKLNVITINARKFPLILLDVIKIVVEGAELKVLRGAINTLESFKPKIIAEVRKRYLQEFLSVVSTLGYICKEIKKNRYHDTLHIISIS